MNDYISKQEAIDRLSEVLSSEAEFEKAKQVIIEAPTISETEIIRKAFNRVVERLEEETIALEDNFGDLVECIPKDIAMDIAKEECGISE